MFADESAPTVDAGDLDTQARRGQNPPPPDDTGDRNVFLAT